MLERFDAVECAVLRHAAHSNGERPVDACEVRRLVDSGLYRGSAGSPVGARHYRRTLEDRSCLHLVIEDGEASLHHDRFDPHSGILSLGMHLAHEARGEAVTGLALAWNLLRILAR
ncbi:MAG TPA: hypothetical protein VLS49_04845 [Usitatibacter sp.]|nr:hypothetical protein [Usitatibacter sp.]